MKKSSFLDGQMLIAMPGMSDPRFDRSVIFMCAHSDNGAMGIIVNKRAPMISFSELLERLDIMPQESRIKLPDDVQSMLVQFGGPVEPGRGFVLHTSDYFSADTSLPIDERVALTATLDILRAIAGGQGPRRSLLALGYAGWAPGQLEDEIQRNGWLSCAADEDLLFGSDLDSKYVGALHKIGVDPAMLSSQAGHA
ncbi:YqgE/AlgH family protein [Taklimakanibacter albus]|uniref:YqgE/AlgH family protein n=1 Tax=Taklimakanibacter albus TaxID=2800327 RepID=A0ACC5RCV1_9HYPH|nr:YqgE/AlgH family protein [Aestuariivirga sp. YIM B02566]MBK1870459.1 YqgE/AlgH family protein [Aestuariivirga sp. YIM B02566]